MSLDMNAAYIALANKIGAEVVNASAEEIAFLGTALERVGGRASVIEIQILANAAKEEITTLKTSVVDDINNMLNTTIQTEIDTRKDTALDEIDASVVAATAAVDQMEADVETQITNASDAIDQVVGQAVTDVNTAISGASGAVTGLNHVTYFMGQQ